MSKRNGTHLKTNVEILRDIRDRMGLEMMNMNFEEIKAYLAKRGSLFPKKPRPMAKKAAKRPVRKVVRTRVAKRKTKA